MSEVKPLLAYPRLCIAYFLQFAIWGAWAGALGGYTFGVLELPGWQIGWLYAAIPLGAVISPLFIGPIADRYFAAQKVVSLLHFFGGLALLGAGAVCQYNLLQGDQLFYGLMALILFSGICFMPTIPLINSIVFKHSPSGSAPYVFVFGTIGWIVVNLFIAAFLKGADEPFFFYAGGGCGILLALYSLTLPDTPPKGAPKPGEKSDALGLGALKLFKDPGFAFFVICVFLASIPACNFFFPFMVDYLSQHGHPSPVALTTLNQFSEIIFMSLLPLAILTIGLKWVVVIGMAAWASRYFIFTIPTFEAAVIGLILHGFCYSFFYAAAYMYADKKAPADLKASVQSLMVFLLLGVGQVLGSQWYGYMHDLDSNKPAAVTDEIFKDAVFPKWDDIKMADSAWKYLDLGKTVTDLMKKDDAQEEEKDLGAILDADKNNVITSAELEKAEETLKIGGTEYKKADIEKTLRNIAKKPEGDFEVARKDYLKIQAYNWKGILFDYDKSINAAKEGKFELPGPTLYLVFFLVLFVLFGREPKDEKKEEKPEETK
ncbi:MAG: MFS transporter [Planctomycetaceae bacterium]|nr:MFS transporter [Planctomycetaceae bacterium]